MTLARHFTLIRFDARGHGESDVPPGPYEIDDFGRDVLDLLDHLGIESAHVAGISLGGMTAMWLAIHAPERVDRIVSHVHEREARPAAEVERPRERGARGRRRGGRARRGRGLGHRRRPPARPREDDRVDTA